MTASSSVCLSDVISILYFIYATGDGELVCLLNGSSGNPKRSVLMMMRREIKALVDEIFSHSKLYYHKTITGIIISRICTIERESQTGYILRGRGRNSIQCPSTQTHWRFDSDQIEWRTLINGNALLIVTYNCTAMREDDVDDDDSRIVLIFVLRIFRWDCSYTAQVIICNALLFLFCTFICHKRGTLMRFCPKNTHNTQLINGTHWI